MEQLNVKLEVFEGPLDLLLHLIDKNKIDIYDIPIVLITQQYMDYIKAMEKEDMNIMSDFLVMAATLLDIKCKMLLPRDESEEEEEGDPRQELVEQLLQYKLYKYMSFELRDRQMDASHSMFKKPTLPKEVSDYRPPINYEELVGDMTLGKLQDIFKDVVKRQEYRVDPIRNSFGKIEKDEVNLDEKLRSIGKFLFENRKTDFKALLMGRKSKMEVIVTFLVVLELMKIGKVNAVQEDNFDTISIVWIDESDSFEAGMDLLLTAIS